MTNQELINQAFEEFGLAGYVYDLQPEQQQMALRRLHSMIAQWNTKGVRIGHSLTSGLNADSGVPDWAEEAVASNLAVRLADTVGKVVSAQVIARAKAGYDSLLLMSARPQERRLDIMPAGAGNKTIQNDIFIQPSSDDPLRTSGDGVLEL